MNLIKCNKILYDVLKNIVNKLSKYPNVIYEAYFCTDFDQSCSSLLSSLLKIAKIMFMKYLVK